MQQVSLSDFRTNTSDLFIPALRDVDIIINIKIESNTDRPHCDANYACYLHSTPSGLFSNLTVQTMFLPKKWVVNSWLDEEMAEV